MGFYIWQSTSIWFLVLSLVWHMDNVAIQGNFHSPLTAQLKGPGHTLHRSMVVPFWHCTQQAQPQNPSLSQNCLTIFISMCESFTLIEMFSGIHSTALSCKLAMLLCPCCRLFPTSIFNMYVCFDLVDLRKKGGGFPSVFSFFILGRPIAKMAKHKFASISLTVRDRVTSSKFSTQPMQKGMKLK